MNILKSGARKSRPIQTDGLKSLFESIDTTSFLWIQRNWSKPSIMPYVRRLSQTGDGWFYLIITLLAISFDWQANQNFLYSNLLAYSIQVPLYLLLKQQFKRNRPQQALNSFQAQIKPSDEFSFPSGHTAAAFVMATQLAIYFPAFTLVAFVWAAGIAMSRVLLGVHFPGDLFAGICLGVLSALLANQLFTLFPFVVA